MQNELHSSLCGRAPRYIPEGVVDYREGPDGEWSHARLLNVSWTGALFETAFSAVAEGATLEFVIGLTTRDGGWKARIRCVGRVVRCREGPAGQWAVATRIEEHEFLEAAKDGHGGSADGVTDRTDGRHFEERNDGK